MGDFISAKNAYKKVIELRPEYIEAYKSLCVILLKLNELRDFPGGPVVKNLLCNAEDIGSIPGQGTKIHMPQSN